MSRALAVVDLGFGDAGKGLFTDFLARRTGAGWVVRFNGGAQAGHNVVAPDGRHHTFAQLGAASFVPGVRTFLAHPMAVHPTALMVEARALAAAGVAAPLDRLKVSEDATLITPFHQAAGRLRELARGEARHGSCGVGVGEVVAHRLAHPDEALVAGDLRDAARLRRKLQRVRERLHSELRNLPRRGPEAAREDLFFERDGVVDAWLEAVRPLESNVAPDSLLRDALRAPAPVIFEGAQGLLLDQTLGFFPYTTWSDCTPRGARALLAQAAPDIPLEVWGVFRAHAVRHGPGPLPTECAEVRPHGDHNAPNPWQGPVRYGWFDAALARYALAHAGPLHGLLLTHLDLLPTRRTWPVGVGYAGALAQELVAQASLEKQAQLTAALMQATPVLRALPGDEPGFLSGLEALLGRTIDAVSRGPRESDVQVLQSAKSSAPSRSSPGRTTLP